MYIIRNWWLRHKKYNYLKTIILCICIMYLPKIQVRIQISAKNVNLIISCIVNNRQ